jgi:hypothetical protein
MSQKEIRTQYTPKQYLSGIYINELVKPNQPKEPYFFVIDLRKNFGIDPYGQFSITPHILNDETLSFYKKYTNLPLALTYYGTKQYHPIEEQPYVMNYKIEQRKIIGKSIAVLSNDPEAILKLQSINVLGQDLHPDFLPCNVIIPKRISL